MPRTISTAGATPCAGWSLDHVPPDQVVWQVGDGPGELFAGQAPHQPPREGAFSVPRPFIDLARNAILHSDRERFALLHTLLVRLRDQPKLMDDQADPLVRKLEGFAKAVRRDIHKMRAFVRFREVTDDGGTRYVAWFEPEFHIVRANAAFFVNRFATMRWSILTPDDHDPLGRQEAERRAGRVEGRCARRRPGRGGVEDLLRVDLQSGARQDRRDAQGNAASKYWKNMPETALVPGLIASAQARESEMVATAKAKIVPGGNVQAAWEALREEAMGCTRCHLYKHATQTVFGEGPVDADLMFVGEQPGDQEDLAGPSVRRPGGADVRPRAGRGRDRPRARLRHQRGQAFQIRTARQAADPFEARRGGDHRRAAGGSIRSWRW